MDSVDGSSQLTLKSGGVWSFVLLGQTLITVDENVES